MQKREEEEKFAPGWGEWIPGRICVFTAGSHSVFNAKQSVSTLISSCMYA